MVYHCILSYCVLDLEQQRKLNAAHLRLKLADCNIQGWLYKLPSFDFAGGGPVHQASGWAALAYALVLGKRKPGAGEEKSRSKPHNTTLVFLGTVLIWFGWVCNMKDIIACDRPLTILSVRLQRWF